MDPTRLSRELRTAQSDDLRRRRWIVGLSLAVVAVGGIVGAYQTGIVRHLPDPPGPFDADRVDASDYAYKRMSTPDGLLMTTTFAVTASLAGAGGADRAARQPFLPLATAAKTIYDAVTALRLAREEWQDNRAFCAYCQLATVTSLVAAALALPEAARAAKVLIGLDRQGVRPAASRPGRGR
jgi:hypothetical protein